MHLVHEDTDGDHHDAAAVLMVDDKIAAAIEEERLNRIKHTDKFPINAIRFVLQQEGIKLEEIDQICYYCIQTYSFEGEKVKEDKQGILGAVTHVDGTAHVSKRSPGKPTNRTGS